MRVTGEKTEVQTGKKYYVGPMLQEGKLGFHPWPSSPNWNFKGFMPLFLSDTDSHLRVASAVLEKQLSDFGSV